MKYILEYTDCSSKDLEKEDFFDNFICNDCSQEFKLHQATIVKEI